MGDALKPPAKAVFANSLIQFIVTFHKYRDQLHVARHVSHFGYSRHG